MASAVDRLNRLRVEAGLRTFAWSDSLARAAQAHADYLAGQLPEPTGPIDLAAHAEDPKTPGFTGESPADRAVAARYPHRRVAENVSLGRTSPEEAIDGLMTAIYHRFSLLDATADEIGIGHRGKVYVLLQGRSDYRGLCAGAIPEAIYEAPARCIERRVAARYLDALCGPLPQSAEYKPPYRFSCPGGVQLDQDFMAHLCSSPPAAALLQGSGTYAEPCGPGTRFAAAWWRGFCTDLPTEARYRGGDGYYSLCNGERKLDRDWMENYCAGLPAAADYAYSGDYVEVCERPVRVHAQWLDRLDRERRNAQPPQILWPPDGARDLPPAFYDEHPDPLPDLEVAGNPLSVQFSPDQARDVELGSFQLWLSGEQGRTREIPLRPVSARTDPNHKLGPLEWAFFPLEHLGWGQDYEAQVQFRVDGEPRTLSWRFKTRDPGVPILTAGTQDQWLEIPPGERVLLFVPPAGGVPRPLASYEYSAPVGMQVDVEPLDYNSAILRVSGAGCVGVLLTPNGGHPIRLTSPGCGHPVP